MLTMKRYFGWVVAGSLMVGACLCGFSSEWQIGSVMDFTDQRVAEKFASFEKKQDVELVYQALDMVEGAERDAPAADAGAGEPVIAHRLRFLAALDRNIDPHWDPKNLPVHGVPLPSEHRVVFPSGEVDPATIPDPVQRAEYVKALKANRDYASHYDVQFQLRRIDERATRDLQRLIAEKYAGSERRQQFEDLLAASPVSESRKERLRAFMAKEQQP